MSNAEPMSVIGREVVSYSNSGRPGLTPAQARRVRHKANKSGELGPAHPSDPGKGKPTPRQAERRETALERCYIGYAIKFCLDSEGESDREPTDANLSRRLAACARRPDPAWYPQIRRYVGLYRAGKIAGTMPEGNAHV